MSVFVYTGQLAVVACPNCHMDFGITADFEKRRRGDRKEFYCPAGHTQWYAGITDAKRIENLKAQVENIRADRDATERSLRATKGVVTRTRNRIHRGVCIHCHRTFENVARHMETKHPEAAAR